MENNQYAHLLELENEQLNKFHEIVLTSINEEKLISTKLEPAEENLTFGNRVSDAVASFGGSWSFILTFLFLMFVWITINIVWFSNKGFDPYPFILLNLILSCIAALQAPIIMMSQNRQEEKDRIRAQNDYLINLKSEIEVRNLHQKIDLLMTEQLKTLFDIQKEQLDILRKIESLSK
jgi:uncharacterized membrane protein